MSRFAAQTYEKLLTDALSRLDSTLDKREGSLLHNSLAPAMAEIARLYIGLDFVLNATYLTTAPREYLILRAADKGLTPKAASAAVFLAVFNIEIPLGTRFSQEGFNFLIVERLPDEDTETAFAYQIKCETTGSGANSCIGDLIPIEYVPGLTTAKATALLIPGEDEEDTEVFRKRVLNAVGIQPFGGNQADYRAKALEIPGIEAVKVCAAWNADTPPSGLIPSAAVKAWYEEVISTITNAEAKAWLTNVYSAALNKKLTVGGTVKVVLMAAGHTVPTDALIDKVQTALDPTQNAGEGMGLAPIGHVVHVTGVKEKAVAVSAKMTLAPGYTWENVKDTVNTAVKGYLGDLAKTWESGPLTVRISQIEKRILTDCVTCVEDISDTTLNAKSQNITLDEDEIPVLTSGGVTDADAS